MGGFIPPVKGGGEEIPHLYGPVHWILMMETLWFQKWPPDVSIIWMDVGRSMSNQPEKMEIETLTSQIFFKLSPVVGIIKSRQS